MLDITTIAGLGTAVLSIGGLSGIVAKYALPFARKLGQVDQVLEDAKDDVSDAQKLSSDIQSLIASANQGNVPAAALVQIEADAKAAGAAFAKTVSDAKAILQA